MIAANELRRRQTRHSGLFNITATKLAQFLESAEAEEVLLRQRLMDRATRSVLSLINGGSQPQTFEMPGSASLTADDTVEVTQQSSIPPSEKSHKSENLETYMEF